MFSFNWELIIVRIPMKTTPNTTVPGWFTMHWCYQSHHQVTQQEIIIGRKLSFIYNIVSGPHLVLVSKISRELELEHNRANVRVDRHNKNTLASTSHRANPETPPHQPHIKLAKHSSNIDQTENLLRYLLKLLFQFSVPSFNLLFIGRITKEIWIYLQVSNNLLEKGISNGSALPFDRQRIHGVWGFNPVLVCFNIIPQLYSSDQCSTTFIQSPRGDYDHFLVHCITVLLLASLKPCNIQWWVIWIQFIYFNIFASPPLHQNTTTSLGSLLWGIFNAIIFIIFTQDTLPPATVVAIVIPRQIRDHLDSSRRRRLYP